MNQFFNPSLNETCKTTLKHKLKLIWYIKIIEINSLLKRGQILIRQLGKPDRLLRAIEDLCSSNDLHRNIKTEISHCPKNIEDTPSYLK